VSSYDIEFWTDLARRDPEGFFRERERAIGEFISAHPDVREQLIALQTQVDTLRAMAGTPIAALRGIFGLMDVHLIDLGEQMVELRECTDRLRDLVNGLD
jgi:hypothetical protein